MHLRDFNSHWTIRAWMHSKSFIVFSVSLKGDRSIPSSPGYWLPSIPSCRSHQAPWFTFWLAIIVATVVLFPVSPSKSGELPSSWRWKVTLWITNLTKTILLASHLIHVHFLRGCPVLKKTVPRCGDLEADTGLIVRPKYHLLQYTQLHVENLDRVEDVDDSKLRHPLVKGHELVHIFEQHLLHVSPPSCQSIGRLGSESNN